MVLVVLLRGINVGTSVRVNMKELKNGLEKCGFSNVRTYINSGNILLESDDEIPVVQALIEKMLLEMTGVEIAVLVKMHLELLALNSLIPVEWTNDEVQRTDVVFGMNGLDMQGALKELKPQEAFLNTIVVPGVLVWNYQRIHYSKTRLNKITAFPWYREITIRNVNTLRYLAAAGEASQASSE